MKNAGIIDVDLRKAKPYWVRSIGPRGGRLTLAEIIRKYDNVISGKATKVSKDKLSASEQSRLRREGAEGIKGGYLIPHAATEKITVDNAGKVTRTNIKGIRYKDTGVSLEKPGDLRQYLYNIRHSRIGKDKNTEFAFRYFGNHSQTFGSIALLLDRFEAYVSVREAIDKRDRQAQNEIIQNFELVTTTPAAWRASKAGARQAAKKRRGKPRPHRTAKALKKMLPFQKSEYHRKEAAKKRAQRAAMTPAELEAYRAKARARAKRAREKKK